MSVSYDRLNQTVRNKFGDPVTYTPAGGSARTVEAIFERNYFSETGGTGIQTESFFLQVVDADLPELATGDAFTISGIVYQAKEIKPDFQGMTEIILRKV